MYIDPYYIILVIPAMIFAAWAQMKVKSTFHKYSNVKMDSGLTGAAAARAILDRNGLTNVQIEHVAGNLSDHYDPRTNVVRLSDSVYNSNSVAAVGVAAHECGHAVQHAEGYFPIKIRTAIIPITQIGSNLAMPLVILGLFMGLEMLVNIGIILFASVALFQLVTLPVEFNASSRAVATLSQSGMVDNFEENGVKKVLTAAALTYVAALFVALANLLRLIALANRRRD
ncbi:MAG: zinc metallopeptidase [Oscillospiraceae bacterium]|nr:zinc metallopeptidase [Oscillospiraceae bacterium]